MSLVRFFCFGAAINFTGLISQVSDVKLAHHFDKEVCLTAAFVAEH